ncbi:alanine racemase [Photobacterium galatheae]|uniref:Broad specificity amino-acid racemase n=1 Tax=Photobacterium galatheae TaxID=1654360 RepID=A0A066RX20_9GAMM|nr:alanine racemase [Photobacterium galatheae]KDM92192.1 alanine racemase [Photobacterium galatheae]MCM0151317.1 alanine racemase [Photobacterium galatheae]
MKNFKYSLIALAMMGTTSASMQAIAAPTLPAIEQAHNMDEVQSSNAWVEVDKAAFESNIAHLQNYVGRNTDICAVMKADAYGNGIANLLPSVIQSGIPCVGITSNAEAQLVRDMGFNGRLMRLRAATPSEIEGAVDLNLEELIGTKQQAKIINRIAKRHGTVIPVHLALNSANMGRNGLEMRTKHGKKEARKIVATRHLQVVGIMTHFPTENLDEIRDGLRQFKQDSQWIFNHTSLDRDDVLLHVANSFTTLMVPEAQLDMVRTGGALYGDTTPEFPEYKRIVSFKTQVASIHRLPAGSTIGYSKTETLKRNSVLANLPIGYSDAFPRSLSRVGEVLINGQRAKVLGSASMNTTMVDITDIRGVKPGAEVVLFGRQGRDEITIGETEDRSGRILSELYTLWGVSNPKVLK